MNEYEKETAKYKALLALAEYLELDASEIPYAAFNFERMAEQAFQAIMEGKIPGVQFVNEKQEKA